MKQLISFLLLAVSFNLSAQTTSTLTGAVGGNIALITSHAVAMVEIPASAVQGFSAIQVNDKAELSWTVPANEAARIFEIQRSTDLKEFKVVAIVMASEKSGAEQYSYRDGLKANNTYYRIRLVDANQQETISQVKQLNPQVDNTMQLALAK